MGDKASLNGQRAAYLGQLTVLRKGLDSFNIENSTISMIDAQLKKLQKLYDAHESIIEALNDLEDCDFEEVYVNEQKFNNAYYQTLEKLNEIRDIKEASIIKKPRNASPVDIRALESARKQLDEYKSKQDDKETKPLNLSELQTTIKILEGVRENYCHKFDIVMGSTSDKADQKAYDKAKCDFDFAYTIVISRYLEELKNLSPPTVVPLPAKSSAPSSGDTDMRLPRLGLPTFDGTPTQWPSFRDRFLSTIHNRTRLDKINKFQYLMSCITDKHSPIADLKETEEGYDAAWQAVIDHYEDKRLIIDNHFRALLKVERMKVEDAEQLAQLLDTFSLSISALERMFSKEQLYGAIIAHMAIFRLAKPTALALEIERKTEIPSWVEVHKLLKQRVKILKAISSSPSESPSQRPSTNVKPNEIRHTKSLVSARSTCCPLCNNQHSLYQCSQFIELSIPDRNTKVKEKHLCFNCLGPHQMKDCTSKSTCRKCEKKHHTLLHRISTSTEAPIPSPSEASKALRLAYLNKLQARDANQQAKPTTANVSTLSAEADSFEISHVTCSASTSSESITLLSTAIVHLRDASGEWHQARALLDSGSDANFITKAVAQALRLKQQTVRVQANGLGSKSTIIDRKITATFCSRLRKNEHEAEFLVTPSITGLTPIRPVSMASLGIPHDMILADPTFHKPGKIDLLIGNQLFWKMFSGQKFELESGVSMMQSPLGWVIAGSVTSSHVIQTVQCNLSTLSDLHNTMERFYKLEDYRNDKGFLTDEEQHCEEFFEQTYKRDEDGRFIITIPFKPNVDQLTSNHGQAFHQFLALEKRLHKNEKLRDEYTKFMAEYEKLGHMQEIDPKVYANQTRFYFPHHAVEKPDSTTTKVRVVFNGSAKTPSGLTLNDTQCIGPIVQSDGITLAFKFRLNPIVIIADIAKMYRMIEVTPEQRNYQLIFWRRHPEEPIKTFELKTVTYGTASASFQSTRCLKQLAIEAREEFPKAADDVEKGFYVDDYISGADTVDSAVELFTQVEKIIASGAMNLRKVYSNNKEFLTQIPHDKCETLKSDDMTIKALGIKWRPATDEIEFEVRPINTSRVTKRIVLSEIAKLYDPQGLIGPVVFTMKTLMKQIWLLEVPWDKSPPENINQQWIELAESITQLSNIRIKRHFMIDNPVDIQLHGFSDASYKGYGAVVYIRSTDIYGNIESHIVCAKSRIAPKEIRSTPRLELCGAVVLAHVMKLVEKSLNIPLSRKMCWSDSAIVLHWLKKEPPQLQPFVANRISEIQQMSHDISWRHIPGAQNPADLISRGLTPGEIIKNQLWWHGSEFLVTVEASWPDSIVQFDPETPDFKNEFKKAQALTCTTQPPNDIVQLVHDSSKLTRTSRIVAHMKRFSFNARARATKQEERKGPLTVNEILDAEVTIIRNFQKQSLPNEFKMLSSARFVPRNSQVKNLDPCWDSTNQIIRVGGRLRHAKHLSQDERNQILIPKGHLSLLIARRAHEDNMHPGKQSTLNIIKMRYWPIDALRTVSKVCHSCIRCFHVRPAIANQFMGQLPATRITPASVFDNTGVDYAGPITIKAGYTRASKTMKCYIALFVCLATKAIHLEVVSELSTKAFIAALDRFISRRGKCSTIHSDHGTNFIGARNYFREMTQFLHQSTTDEIIRNHLTKQEIQWKHIPPRNPEAGGLWEAGVKSAKYHLSRVTKNANLHYEELSTLMCQIEAILNSRPITQLSTDPNDPQALTAGHFLIGRPLIAPPQRNVLDVNFNRLQRWDRIIQIKQDFWRRWNQGYLHRLQVRTRNYKDKNPVKVGHMVLLHVDNAPPLHWPLGIITDIFPGNDGITRVARIRCSGSTFDRPVNKLAILPTADNNDDN